MSEKNMLSIWFFVGVMLSVFGLIVTLTGINYLFNPQHQTVVTQVNAHIWWGLANPNLWWGAIMLIAGLFFLIPSYSHFKSGK
ncbi:hypothetical protein BMS3Abin05_01542 [bacterium BMS3Abin05]|nr:hypothetical protein BMS3Abin05_01542 [bacterium BMS3Abin05]GBE27245.1 hypothetical protein BMS3Bbin03_01169 [bacterium BMS3Bbin03]HDK36553.1 hypothetical protein [Bacteroidota bacterium]HDZ10840.1 hypothetical protein [Bacteroidota bacterium]